MGVRVRGEHAHRRALLRLAVQVWQGRRRGGATLWRAERIREGLVRQDAARAQGADQEGRGVCEPVDISDPPARLRLRSECGPERKPEQEATATARCKRLL